MHISILLASLAALLPLALAGPPPLPGPKPQPTCTAYPSGPPSPPLKRSPNLKVTIPIYKLDNVTTDYFHSYWTSCSIPLAEDCPDFTQNVAKFAAIQNDPQLRADMAARGFRMLDYDGIIEFWVPGLDAFVGAVTSGCWQTVRRDAESFTKFGEYVFMYGYEVVAHDRT